MEAAIGAVRSLRPAQVISAVPVSSTEGHAVVARADLAIGFGLREPFGNAGMWYRDFSRPGDDQASSLLE